MEIIFYWFLIILTIAVGIEILSVLLVNDTVKRNAERIVELKEETDILRSYIAMHDGQIQNLTKEIRDNDI